jgi:hypothetical protein
MDDEPPLETFIRIYTARSGFRGEARFATWVFSTCARRSDRPAIARTGLKARATKGKPAEAGSAGRAGEPYSPG